MGSRLAYGVFWSMAGAVISRGLMLCATVIVARILGKTLYGEFGIIQSTIGMLGIFAGFGIGLTATKHVAELKDTDPDRVGRIISFSGLLAILTSGVMAAILLWFAPWLAENTLNAPHLTNYLRIGALLLFINALNGAQTGVLSGFEAFKTIAHVNLIAGLVSFPTLVCGTYLYGLWGAVWALVINLGFNWLLNHIALRKEAHRYNVSLSIWRCWKETPLLWNFALPATLSSVMVGPANWACRAILANTADGYGELGVLTAALVFQTLMLFIANMLSAPLLSMISNAKADISEKLGTVNILATWILGVIFAIPLLCFPELAQLSFGNDYATHSFQVTFSLIVFCTTIMTFKAGLARVLAANSLLWWGFLSNTLWASILMGCTILFIEWGAPGVAAALAIAYVLNTVVLVPLYCSKNLVPRKTLISYESGLIWLMLSTLLFLSIIDADLPIRIAAFLISIGTAAKVFHQLLKHSAT